MRRAATGIPLTEFDENVMLENWFDLSLLIDVVKLPIVVGN